MEDTAPLFHVYRMKLLQRAIALFIASFGASFVIFSINDLISGTSEPDTKSLLLGVTFLAAGIGTSIYAFTARISFTQTTVEHRTILSRKELPLNQIKGRRERMVTGKGGSTKYLSLVPDDDRLRTLEFSVNYALDEAFYRWFQSLPDLDANDKEMHKDSNFGLV